ncbi:hypothetical protein WJX72_002789 [[Myrmecia] bisecta]|uniref:Uncharacterized protein n=1 Tax=[Myrmecia] bisecta TaxID=41462 RepID=A0AAW1P9K0_9CHLO
MGTLQDGSVRFTCPPERFISAPQDYIMQDSTERVAAAGQDGEQFRELCKLLEATCQFEFLEIRRRVKSNFNLFSLATAGKPLPKRRGKEVQPESAELDQRELRFVEDFYTLLKAAHYRLLSQEEWETALAEEFTFTMPVDVKWDLMDSSLLKRFWAGRQAERASLADISDHIIVFHRGIKTVKARGTYINEKIDLLTDYLIVNPLKRLCTPFLKTPGKDLHKMQRLVGGARDSVQYSQVGKDALKASAANNGSAPPRSPDPAALEQAAQAPKHNLTRSSQSLEHSNAKTVERRTLQRLMPDARAVLANLFAEVEIQEPTWKDVVVLYRRAVPATADPSKKVVAQQSTNPDLARRNINIKTFDDVPMADCEMIFPDKRVYMKPITVIQLVITIAVALITAITSLLSTGIDMRVVMGVLSVVLTRAFTVYNQAQIAKQLLVDQMTERLYEKTLDSQEGVIYMLLDQMASQHIKEVLLAYTLLLLNGGPLSQAALDEACERYLDSAYGLRLDFAIEHSLPRLLADGLVKQDGQGLLSAVPLAEAVRLLRGKWERYFDLQDESEVSIPGGQACSIQDILRPRLPAKAAALPAAAKAGGDGQEGLRQVNRAGPGAPAEARPDTSAVRQQKGGPATPASPAQPATSPAHNQEEASSGTPKRRSGFKKLIHNLKGE